MDLYESLFDCSAYYRVAERAVKEFRYYRKDVYSHVRMFLKVVIDCKNSNLMSVILKKMVYLRLVYIYKPITPEL